MLFNLIKNALYSMMLDPMARMTITIDGQQVSWESYARSLQATIDWCDAKLDDGQPFEERSVGIT